VACGDWVFSTWRNHYHALLHKIPAEKVMAEIRAGRSMNLTFPEHRFYSSAIVGGILPIAVGVAAALKRNGCLRKVWCFVGDMAATTGAFHEASDYAAGHDLPVHWVIEDNGVSTNTPTEECWGNRGGRYKAQRYQYTRTYPHVGIGKWVQF
jgi:TPP-dependent pyruvate/acetoin dehydrogenase alpha subunit